MTRLEKAALEVHRAIWWNVGGTADWPIQIMYNDGDTWDRMAMALNELRDAAEEVEPGIGAWPVGREVEGI